MRTIHATLHAALMAGRGKPKIVAHVGYADGSELYTATPVAYKLTGTILEVRVPNVTDLGGDQVCIWLERGLTINGTDYTVTTGRFFINFQQYFDDETQLIQATLFPVQKYTGSASGWYTFVIEAFCNEYGKTAVYADDTEDWLLYNFLPLGQSVITNDANHFLNMLIQKRLVYACDNGDEEVRFYSADVMGAAVATIPVKDGWYVKTTKLRTRQYMWHDELASVHLDGAADDPIHNLGYLESTDSPPARHAPTAEAQAIMRPDLRIQDGDVVTLQFYDGSSIDIFAQPTEIYDPRGSTRPEWRVQLDANPVIHSTEAGALPSTIVRVSNYTPLSTGTFDGILSSADNNLQAAMETLDEHNHRQVFTSHMLGATVPASTTYNWPPGTAYFGATGYNALFPAGTIKNLRCNVGAQPASGSFVITILANSVATAVTITVPAGDGGGAKTDLVNSVHIAAGTTIRVEYKNNATAPSAVCSAIGFEFYADP